jgi:LAO/AO transport system kinase
LGDDIQAIKAGILEIADILVVNKADRPGVESTERALRSMLQLAHPTRHIFVDTSGHHAFPVEFSSAAPAHSAGAGDGNPAAESDEWMWTPPILRTVAIEGEGVQELSAEITRHRQYLVDSGGLEQREKQRVKTEVDGLLHDRLLRQWRSSIPAELYNQVIRRVTDREISPWQAARELAG